VDFIVVPNANAGRDDEVCGLAYTLAAEPSVGISIWTAPMDVTFLTSPSLPNALINVSSYSGYTFKWQETNQICTNEDEVYVAFYEQPEAYAGEDQRLEFVYEALLEAAMPVAGEGQWHVVEGKGTINDPSQPSTRVSELSVGRNLFRWTVANGPCIPAFDEVLVFVEDLVIPNIFSPNSDGKNDFFMIPGLERLEPTQLTIYNRWGNIVYETANYKNDWQGYNQNNKMLPNDTYFYTLILPGGLQYSGYITLRK
jgi:gliding motility-associated-like protein